MLRTSSHVLSTSRKHTVGFLVQTFEVFPVSAVLHPPVTGGQFTVFLLKICPCRESLIMTVHGCFWNPTGVCAVTTPFHSLHQWFSTFSLKGAKSRPTILLENSLKFFNTIQLTRFVLQQNEVLRKILEVLLKDCWEPHKRCLGVARGSQSSGWEPLL